MSSEIAYREIDGRVQIVNDRDSNDWYGICIDEEWFNGDGSTEIEEGDYVKIAVKESDNYSSIEAVKTIQDDGQNSTQSGKVSSKAAGGAAPNPLTKNQQINLKVAHKSAVRQLDRRSAESDEDYREMLTKLTRLHLESLKEVEEWMQE